MKTVVFDLGQVVIKWDPYLPLEGYLTRQEWDAFTLRTGFWAANHALDGGARIAEIRRWYRRHHPADVEIFSRYVQNFRKSLTGPVPGVREIIADLHARNVETAVLSNWSAETFQYALESMPIIECLGPRIVSGVVGVAKPDPLIFQLLLEKLGAKPGDLIFIDDAVANCSAASQLGIDAIRFENAAQLRTELALRRLIPASLRRV